MCDWRNGTRLRALTGAISHFLAIHACALIACLWSSTAVGAVAGQNSDTSPQPSPQSGEGEDISRLLSLPAVGEHHLRVLSPNILELELITTTPGQNLPPKTWAFVN